MFTFLLIVNPVKFRLSCTSIISICLFVNVDEKRSFSNYISEEIIWLILQASVWLMHGVGVVATASRFWMQDYFSIEARRVDWVYVTV